ncbi:MAG: hypothetical protein LBI72_11430 [Flavobacteriaceae bacterium]|jgi:hypothetical protein|nr:hypothetical protein [Flavobacteriaceae bacterium]
MAKTIKQISCPVCSSAKVTKLEHHYYMCNSCSIRFFLETDDVTVTHIHQDITVGEGTLKQKRKNNILIVIGVGVALVLGLSLASLFSTNDTINRDSTTITKKTEKVSGIESGTITTLQLKNGKEILVNIVIKGRLVQGGGIDAKGWLVIQEVPSGKILKQSSFEVDFSIAGEGSNTAISVRWYKNTTNTLYAIVNHYYLFRFDESTFEMVDITKNYFEGIDAFESGVSYIGIDQQYPEFMCIGVNSGKKYVFSKELSVIEPSVRMTEVFERRRIAEKIYNLPKTNPTIEKRFAFTSSGQDNYPIRLVAYNINTQKGYPTKYARFSSWSKGVAVYKEKDLKDVISYDNFTPDREYYKDSKVLSTDEEGVVIAIKMARLSNEPYTIQKLKLEDGSILWSKKTMWKDIYSVYNTVSKDYILLSIERDNFIVLDKEGKTTIMDMNYELEIE